MDYKASHRCKECSYCSCTCCTDYVDPLSEEERVIKLAAGFIRILSKKYHQYIPIDIYSLCIDYVGSASGFHPDELMSNTQNRRIYYNNCCKNWCQLKRYKGECWGSVNIMNCILGDCESCIEYICIGSLCQEHYRYGSNQYNKSKLCLLVFCIICKLLCFFIFFIGKDIAVLVYPIIFGHKICDNAIEQKNKIGLIHVDEWLMIGSITHLAIMVLLCSRCWRLFAKSNMLFRIIRYGLDLND